MQQVRTPTWLLIVLAGLIAAVLVADGASAQDFDDDAFIGMPDKGGHHSSHFQGSGKVRVTQTTPCSTGDTCFVFTGSVNGDGGSATVKGNGTNSNCETTDGKTCCSSDGTATVAPSSGGTIDFSFTGSACSKKATKETLTGLLAVTGGTGEYAGATGSGQFTLTDNPETGKGNLSASGTIR